MHRVKPRFHTLCCHAESKREWRSHIFEHRDSVGVFDPSVDVFEFIWLSKNPSFAVCDFPLVFTKCLISLFCTAVYTTCMLVRRLMFATRTKESMLLLAFSFGYVMRVSNFEIHMSYILLGFWILSLRITHNLSNGRLASELYTSLIGFVH